MRIDPGQKEVKVLKRLVQLKGKRVLEIGCGEGRMSFPLAFFAEKYIAIDPDKEAIVKARKKMPKEVKDRLEFRDAFGDKTGLPDKSIDTILMILCFHEIVLQKQGPTLKECWRILKDGGQLLIVDPTDLPGQAQSLYDVVNKNILFFDHPVVVKHSKWVAEEFIKRGSFRLERKTRYKVDWHFKDLEELVGFVMDEFEGRTEWTSRKKRILENGARGVVGELRGKEIVVYDEMEVLDLRKGMKDASRL